MQMQQFCAHPAAMKPSRQLQHPLWTHIPTTTACVSLIYAVSTTFLSLIPGFPGRKFISGRGTAQTEELARPWTISL